jgi:hypothetical protein
MIMVGLANGGTKDRPMTRSKRCWKTGWLRQAERLYLPNLRLHTQGAISALPNAGTVSPECPKVDTGELAAPTS